MYLIEWSVNIVKPKMKMHFPIPILVISARLQCPVCQDTIFAKSSGIQMGTMREFHKEPSIETLLGDQIKEITEKRECKKCVILSGISEAEKNDFENAVRKKVTEEWLQEKEREWYKDNPRLTS